MLPCQGYSKRLRSRVWETPKIEKWRSSRQSETPIFPVCGHTGCACYSASHSGMASTIFRKCTYTCCACQRCPEFGVKLVIPKGRLSRILQRKPATVAFLRKIFGITFCLFLLLVFSNSRLKQNNSG